MYSTVIAFLESIIGVYVRDSIPDWEWIISACFLLLIVWGVIIIVRSVISKHV